MTIDISIWIIAFIGGLVGSVFMDITEAKMAKYGISSGVNAGLIGRWAAGLVRGKLYHQDIQTAPPVKHEVRIGIGFHFIIGGGVVAFFYPIMLMVFGLEMTANPLLFATLFGLLTSVLPWFVLMPSFGWGWFGLQTPFKTQPIVSPILSHIPFGFGIGLVFWLATPFFA